MKEQDLLEKYNIVHIKGLRYYKVNLKEREFDFENTIPYCCVINSTVIRDSSWKNLISKIVHELDRNHEKSIDELLSIKCDWGKQSVFSDKALSNYTPYRGIFINTNHTAIHAMWTIQLILNTYHVDLDSCVFIIKRQPSAEPVEIKKYFKEKNLNYFKKYLLSKGKSDKTIELIIKNISFINSKVLSKISSGYDDFFLMEDTICLSNYLNKALLYLKNNMDIEPKAQAIIRIQFNYLLEFMKNQLTENKINYKNFNIELDEAGDNDLNRFLNDFDSAA